MLASISCSLPRNFRSNPPQGGLQRPAVHPVEDAQGEEVLAAVNLAGGQARVLEGLGGEPADVQGDDPVSVEAPVVEGALGVAGHLEVLGDEAAGVQHQGAAGLHVAEVPLEGGGVHGHQHVEVVTGGEDLGAGEVELEPGDPSQGPGRRPDLGRVVGESGQVVADQGTGVGELGPGELHPIAGITGETDDYRVQGFDFFVAGGPRGRCRHGGISRWHCGPRGVSPPGCGPLPGRAGSGEVYTTRDSHQPAVVICVSGKPPGRSGAGSPRRNGVALTGGGSGPNQTENHSLVGRTRHAQ